MTQAFVDFWQKALTIDARHRVLAIGDVHGNAGLLQQLFDLAAIDICSRPLMAGQKLMTVFLGDACGRGDDTKGVYDLLIERDDVIAIQGNHDRDFLELIDDLQNHTTHAALPSHFHADSHIFSSYGAGSYDEILRLAQTQPCRLADHVPESHRDFLRQMPEAAHFGDYLFVHNPVQALGLPLAKMTEKTWEGACDYIFDHCHNFTVPHDHPVRQKIIVHGHIAKAGSPKPEHFSHRIGLEDDTEGPAADKKMLYGVLLEMGQKPRFLMAATL